MGRVAKSIDKKPASRWQAAHACVAGTAHQYEGAECQDAAAVTTHGEALAACVCDGAGSAPLSHIGASVVAKQVSRLLATRAEDIIRGKITPTDIIARARRAIAAKAEAANRKPEEYACTLVGLVLIGNRAITVHLGDGLIAAVEAGVPRVLSGPDNDEYINYTTFVTSSDALDRVRMCMVAINSTVTSFALMSDGSQASLFNRQKNTVSQVIEQMASWLDASADQDVNREVEATIRQHFLARTQDDCSLIVIRRQRISLRFICPVCQRWEIRRYRRGGRKGAFRVKCVACGNVMRFQGQGERSYPRAVRGWVKHLARTRHFALPKVHDITGIPRSTLWTWLRKGPK